MTTRKRRELNDQQAMAYVRIGNIPTAAMADTGTRRSIIDPEIAQAANAKPTGRTGVMHIAGHKLTGRIMRVAIRTREPACSAVVDAFVPNPGQHFRKGVMLGMDFLQKAKMRIDGETGEVYCPIRTRKR